MPNPKYATGKPVRIKATNEVMIVEADYGPKMVPPLAMQGSNRLYLYDEVEKIGHSIVIDVEGGIVQRVVTDNPFIEEMETIVLNRGTSASNDYELVKLKLPDETLEVDAYVEKSIVAYDPEYVLAINQAASKIP